MGTPTTKPGAVERQVGRPLQTGVKYAVVFERLALHYAGWDRARYPRGAQAALRLVGEGLGAPLEVRVELDDGGAWSEVARLETAPGDGGSTASAQWTVPQSAPAGARLRARVLLPDGRAYLSGVAELE